MTRYYVDKTHPDRGFFEVSQSSDGWRWHWAETAKGIDYHDFGRWMRSEAEAYRDAADDWDDNGSSANGRLSGWLRAAATRAERSEVSS